MTDPLRARLAAKVAEWREQAGPEATSPLQVGVARSLRRCADELEAALRAAPEADAEVALREASQALDELVAADPSKSLAQRIRDEFADFKMVVRHCSEIYDHFSRGRVSKPNTLPREVITIAEDFQTQEIEEAIAEAREEWEAALLATPEPEPSSWLTLCPDCDHGIRGGAPCPTCDGQGTVAVVLARAAAPEAEDDALQIARHALHATTVLDLGKTPDGKDDFYSGPDRFFRAHKLACEALVKLDTARPVAPEKPR